MRTDVVDVMVWIGADQVSSAAAQIPVRFGCLPWSLSLAKKERKEGEDASNNN